MRILLINMFYTPDKSASAHLFSMLCEDLVSRGHQVSVIAAVPHYPTGRVPKEFQGRIVQWATLNGVHVIRVWLPSVDRSKLVLRFLTFVAYQLLAALVVLFKRDYDVVIGVNAAIETALPFLLAGPLRHKASVYYIGDLYPEIGVKLGIFRNSFVIKIVGFLEDLCIKQATYVRILCDSFARALKVRCISEDKLVLIYDWVDLNTVVLLPRSNEFSVKYELENRFVVMYAGNIGAPQGLDVLVESARTMRVARPDVCFVIVGEGTDKARLRQSAEEAKLQNLLFVPFQNGSLLARALATADVSFLSLRRGLGEYALPSKLYSLLASGRPIIAAVDEGSDTWTLIERANAGLCVPPEDPDSLSQAIIKLHDNLTLRESFGRCGRDYVERYHSREIAAQHFENLLIKAIANVH